MGASPARERTSAPATDSHEGEADGTLRQAKSDFVAMMTHELRTPLNAILGFSDILAEGIAGPLNDQQRVYLSRVQESGRHLLRLINDILDFSKAHAGRMTVRREPCRLRDIVHSAVAMLEPLIAKKRLEVVAGGDAVVHADAGRVRQVLYNLLSNAVKFSNAGGKITVHVEKRGGMAVVSVADQGIGISSEDIARIFVPFTQLERPATRTAEGTGLGLALSRTLVEIQGGTLDVESEPGAGATFRFTLPLSRVTSAPEPRRRVAVVIDDDPSAREIFAMMLRRCGFSVRECARVDEGVRLVRELKPQLVALEVAAEGMRGWSALTELKSDPDTSSIPVVVASIEDEADHGLRAGASAYLLKPAAHADLVGALSSLDLECLEVPLTPSGRPPPLAMFAHTLAPPRGAP